MAKTRAGSIFMMGISRILLTRSPAAMVRMPPHPIKSFKSSGVVSGTISWDRAKIKRNTTSWGTATYAGGVNTNVLPAKIRAVNKSITALESRMEDSPDIPSISTP